MFKCLKSIGIWIWIVAFITFTPLVIVLVLLTLEVYTDDVRGIIIQSMASVPLLFAFRQRLAAMLHDVADWICFGKGDGYKEKTKIYKLFRLISGLKRPESGKVAVIEKSLVSIFDYLGLIFIIFYYITGIYLQNISD